MSYPVVKRRYSLAITSLSILCCYMMLNVHSSVAQSPFRGYETLFTKPRSYTLYHSDAPLKMDGELNESQWAGAPWTEYFIDIEGEPKPAPAYKTQVKMLWDEKYLYIAARMEEPHLWANKQSPADNIFRDNVFKIFIDPNNDMNDDFEIQINPDNLMLFLIMNKPYRDGGTPVTGWVPIGLQSGVKLNGTLNNSSDKDTGWVAEIAIPLASLSFNPKDERRNTGFRINFMRTGWDFTVQNNVYSKALDAAGKPRPPHYAVWSSQGLINMHLPERWGYTVFSPDPPSNKSAAGFVLPYSEKQRDYLWLAYYKQKDWFKKTKAYTASNGDLGIPENDIIIDGVKNRLSIETTSKTFLATITDEAGQTISVNQDGYVNVSAGSAIAPKKTELLILPTIHGGHARNVKYTFNHVMKIIENFKPDIIAVEIRPEDIDQDSTYLKRFYQPEMIMARAGFPGVQKAGIDFLGAEMQGKSLPPDFNRDTIGEMGKLRVTNQKLMKDSAIIKARIAKGMVSLKAKQGEMMGKLSAGELLDGTYDKVTDEYTRAQTAVLANTPYQYYDDFSIQRDQKLADNIRELAIKNPGKRVIVLTGANHHNRAINTMKTVSSVHLVTTVQDY
ncbi:MAG: carbohydrate-binding family 9-like protein [Daejeonella sp.]|uniref:carbohydrate-binding family 9-like protein n=1 Tax=Daejeonella sp. JGW-45 TaxID=3034148 RepID=UPI0023EA845C|nr:carbohydrate-binding family 9-like protein [Daejeonella sp. JGW-45]